MSVSPLNIQRIWFSRLCIDDGGAESGNGPVDIDIDFDLKRHKDKLEFLCVLKASFKASSQGTAYKLIEFDLTGIFSFSDDTEPETVNALVPHHLLVILHGYARGILHQLTSTSSIGPFVLPAVDYFEVVNKKVRESKRRNTSPNRSKAKVNGNSTNRSKS